MREVPFNFSCFQFELPGNPKAPRATSSAHAYRPRPRNSGRTRPLSCTSMSRNNSHNCIANDNDNYTKPKDSQHTLVKSALRRPHATSYSPLDYQTMPNVGKSSKQPYRSQSTCIVYRYTSRPISANKTDAKYGKHTKSSLLRNKSNSHESLSSKTNASESTPSRPISANKRLCEIREDYRFFKTGAGPKHIPRNGESLHSFLTGARYNNTRFLDSRTLSKLGVYVAKADLNSFFIKEDCLDAPCDDANDVKAMSDLSEDIHHQSTDKELLSSEKKSKAVNTEPHYLSIEKWHSADWKTTRKPTTEKAPRAHTAPSRFKPINSFYYDYDTGKKYNAS